MLAVIALVVGPIDYAAGGTAGLGAGLVGGLGFGLAPGGRGGGLGFGLAPGGRGGGLGAGLVGGLGFGLAVGLGVGLVGGLGFGLAGGLGVGLGVGLAGGLTFGRGVGLRVRLRVGLAVGLAFGLGAGLAGGLGVGLGAGFGAGLGVLLHPRLREPFTDVPNIWPYLRLMGHPLLGYTLGYAALVVWFASVYAALYRWSGHLAFSVPFAPHFGDFLFFAITIFPPIGAYSDVKPLAPWAQSVVAGELIMGVGYTSVIFAAIISYLTPAFGKLSKNKEPSTEEVITDLKTDLRHAQEQTHTALSDLDQRMARIERQMEELTKQRTSADAPPAPDVPPSNGQRRKRFWRNWSGSITIKEP